MLEYFTYKKVKKNKEAKKAQQQEEAVLDPPVEKGKGDETQSHNAGKGAGTAALADIGIHRQASSSSNSGPGRPVLDRSDESFLESILSQEGPAPPLPDRVTTPELDWPSDDASSRRHSRSDESAAKDEETQPTTEKAKKEDGKKPNRLSLVFSNFGKKKSKHGDTLRPEDAKLETEEEKEKHDMNRVLDRLNLSAKNNKVISLSDESAEVLKKFTQVFKDLANGVPTAYDDLVNLIKDRDGVITKGFEKLPSGLQKLVMQLPEKVTASIAPEVLATAAKSQGMEAAAENLLSPQVLFELLTKPGALVGMLRAIVTALQQRWPAFIGVNVIWSVALCLLMFVLWYCYKRGRETRLEKEKSESEGADGDGLDQQGEPSGGAISEERREVARPAAEPSTAEPRSVPQ